MSILHDDRCTPVLEPHGTAQVRMQRCVVGDSQWFHNILCGPVDLRAFNADQAERPSAAAGNVYLDAAHPSEWDVDMVAAVSVGAAVLEERTDGWYLTMPTSPEWRGAVPRARVTTATLNPAVVPGQRFTLPNGGDIALDRDLVGAVRPEIGVFPGPIEDPTSTPIRIWPRA